jgi:hypothetical protein
MGWHAWHWWMAGIDRAAVAVTGAFLVLCAVLALVVMMIGASKGFTFGETWRIWVDAWREDKAKGPWWRRLRRRPRR